MPRRRPAPPRPSRPSAEITGLSLATCREFDRLGIYTALVAGHLASWRRIASSSAREFNHPFGDDLLYIGPSARDGLENALRALPGRRVRELRVLVERIDAVVLRKTIANPRAAPDLPWWHRRWTDCRPAR